MSKSAKYLLAFLGGLVAGTVIGVLFAPDKGENTRSDLGKAAKKFKDKAANTFKNNHSSSEKEESSHV